MFEPKFPELCQDLTDSLIHSCEHGGIGSTVGVADVFKTILESFGWLHGSMYCIVGKVQEKGAMTMSIDETECLAGECVCEVLLLVHGCGASHNRVVCTQARVDVGVLPIGKAKELVKSSFKGMEMAWGTQLPLAYCTGGITCRGKDVGEGNLGQGQAYMFLQASRRWRRVVVVPETLLVTARHESGAGWAAPRGRDVTICETNAFVGYGIDVWCRDIFTPMAANIGIAQVVCDDDDDIRPGLALQECGKLAAGKCERRGADTCSFQEIASFHILLYCFRPAKRYWFRLLVLLLFEGWAAIVVLSFARSTSRMPL